MLNDYQLYFIRSCVWEKGSRRMGMVQCPLIYGSQKPRRTPSMRPTEQQLIYQCMAQLFKRFDRVSESAASPIPYWTSARSGQWLLARRPSSVEWMLSRISISFQQCSGGGGGGGWVPCQLKCTQLRRRVAFPFLALLIYKFYSYCTWTTETYAFNSPYLQRMRSAIMIINIIFIIGIPTEMSDN